MGSETATPTAAMSCPAPQVHPVDHVHAAPPVAPASLLVHRRLLLALVALLAAFATAAALNHGQVLLTWDAPIQRRVEASRTPGLTDFFLAVSRLGSTIPVLSLGVLGVVLTWRRCRAVSTVLLVATFSRPLLEFVIKALVDRDRPDLVRLVDGTGPSFPSGHVMAAFALWGLLPVVVSLYTRNRAVWWASVGTSVLLIVSIAASRVYLGVHWFSDVTAGLIVGGFFLAGADVLLRRQHARHPCRLLPKPAPPVEVGDGDNETDEIEKIDELDEAIDRELAELTGTPADARRPAS